MAYVLPRQDIGCKLSAAKSEDPAQRHVLRGFCVNLLTSTTPQMSYLRS
jgi:hypothetical protein